MKLGAHVSTSGGIHTAIDRAQAIGAESVQIFTQSPRAWRPTNHDPANLELFKERRAEAGIDGVLCHALYLVNLASPDDAVYEKSVATLVNTVQVASAIDADVCLPRRLAPRRRPRGRARRGSCPPSSRRSSTARTRPCC